MKRRNSQKDAFLRSISDDSCVEAVKEKFEYMAFSLQFFDNSQKAGQDFHEWTREQLERLLDKLKSYCGNTMEYWKKQRIGHGHSHVLEIYERFPFNSGFTHPKHVPADVQWGRWRLEYDMRLVGFTIGSETCTRLHISSNVFYIVFLDANHLFYKSA